MSRKGPEFGEGILDFVEDFEKGCCLALMFNAFIRSFHLYIHKFKEKTINNDKCFIQLWLMPLLGLLIILRQSCVQYSDNKIPYGYLYKIVQSFRFIALVKLVSL